MTMGMRDMRTRPKTNLTLISLLILAALAVPIGAADPDVYMNTAAPGDATCPVSPSGCVDCDGGLDLARHAAASADADVYLRGETSTGEAIGSAVDVASLLEVLADVLASLLH
jgi:hypothetical protein